MLTTRNRRRAALFAALVVLAGLLSPAAGQASAVADVVQSCSPHPAPHHYSCFALRRADANTALATPAATPAGYGPASLQSAYNLPSTTAGSGQRVFVIDAFDDPTAESDLAVYRAQYNLPACTTANGCFVKMSQTGSTTALPPAEPTWAGETSLDLDMVSAACPNCAITLIEADDDSDNLFTAIDLANSLGAKYVSMSWGGGEVGDEASYDAAHFNRLGVAYVVASGDSGYNNGISYPASSPAVVSVGGTSLVASAGGRGWSETVWSNARGATGSGCSSDETKPTWQSGIPSSVCPRRAGNDVSVFADPNHGVAVYQTYGNSGWAIYGGTSAGAPFVAGIYALAGAPVSTDNPASYLYEHPNSLYDVTNGTNGSCSSVLCSAGPGWDGPTGLGTPNGVGAFAPATHPGAAGSFTALAPTRILDTRSGLGTAAGPVAAGGVVRLAVTGTSTGLPYSGVSAVVLNLTVTQPQAFGYLAAFPDGSATPLASNLNFGAGQNVPNLAVVPVGADGRIALLNGSSGSSHLIADLTGYYIGGSPAGPGAFGSLAPNRVLDTRSTSAVAAGASRAVPVLGHGGVPNAGVSAVVVNVTATQPQSFGYATAYPSGAAPATVSNLNFSPGQTIANLAVVPVGADGSISVLNGSTGSTHFIVDITGYYLTGSASGTFATLAATTRFLDTRGGPSVTSGASIRLPILGVSGVPLGGVSAVVINLTATQPQTVGYLTAYPTGSGPPTVSNLNFVTDQTVAGLAIVPIGSDGSITLFNGSNGGTTHFIADVVGYFLS